MIRRPPRSPLFPYPPLSRSAPARGREDVLPHAVPHRGGEMLWPHARLRRARNVELQQRVAEARRDSPESEAWLGLLEAALGRSEEHTSELQSLAYLVCRLLL